MGRERTMARTKVVYTKLATTESLKEALDEWLPQIENVQGFDVKFNFASWTVFINYSEVVEFDAFVER